MAFDVRGLQGNLTINPFPALIPKAAKINGMPQISLGHVAASSSTIVALRSCKLMSGAALNHMSYWVPHQNLNDHALCI